MNPAKPLIIVLLLSIAATGINAQHFYAGVNAGYTQIKYSFPVEKDAYHGANIKPFNAFKMGASVDYGINKSIRIGTGIEYLSIKGTNDGGHIGRTQINPNSEGQLTFDVDNAFLLFPVRFEAQLMPEKKFRPTLSAGLQFFKPLNQHIAMSIEADDPDPAYEEVKTFMNEDAKTSYFGARIGAGVTGNISERNEISLMLLRHLNVSRYEYSNPFFGEFEKHEVRFYMWEVALAYHIRLGN